VGRGRSKCPSYHPPTPYTLSPLPKGGEGRGEGGSYTHVPCPFGALLVTLYHFLTQTFFLGGTSPQRPRPTGRGCSKCPSYHPPTPYTLSPLFKGGEGRGEGGSYTHVPCPFGALLVTLYQIFSKRFLNGKGDMGGASPASHKESFDPKMVQQKSLIFVSV